MTRSFKTLDTAAVHAGEPDPRVDGAVVQPVFQSSIFLHEGTTDYHATRYTRLSNTPNQVALQAKLAALENAEAALVTASGMAAISASLMSVAGSGDHVLVLDAPYGGTRNFVDEDLPRFGIERTWIDGQDPDSWRAAVRPSTRAIYVESITNPLMRVPDLEAVVAFAREHDLVSMIDNTLATPVNFRPAEIGFDLSLHSATKYLGGHTDLIAGAVIGRAELVEKAHRLLNHLGGMLDPRVCVLLQRGVKTLVLRVRHQNESALRLARFLSEHPAVARVNHPGLEANPGHDIARRLFNGFGGMLSLELHGGVEAAERFIDALTIPIHAVSLGGVESLVIRPAVTAYAGVSPDERRRLGVSDALVRLSVGIEDADELRDDLDAALAAVALDKQAI